MPRIINTRFFTVTIFGFIIAFILFASGIIPYAGAEERPVHPGYPKFFDKIGRLERLADGEAVVSDSLFRVSASATYHTPRQRNASRSRFRPGDRVGCLINADGEIESIWFISRNRR